MKIMIDLPPTEFQLTQIRKFLEVTKDFLNLDDFDETLQDDNAFALWDDIATDEYVRQGGTFEPSDPNEPTDIRFFGDCQTYATDLISQFASKV